MSQADQHTAIDAPTQWIETGGRKLAYRSIGSGKPIILSVRFRGTMDSWDPAFLDALVRNGFRVVTFDYSGVGRSTGTPTYDVASLARDGHDLMEALDLRDAVTLGWSIGGMAVQVNLALHPERVSHVVLVGTTPPGPLVKQAEQLFFTTAAIPDYDLDDEVILFFEPRSEASRNAARRSHDRIARRIASDRSPPVPMEVALPALAHGPRNPVFPSNEVLAVLQSTSVPMLHIGGDHDIIFPVENWYALNQRLPTLQLLTFPLAGHGPQHEHPDASADYIGSFVRNTSRKPLPASSKKDSSP
jgi:pimeloyl-ACP methyl ester carboxylesterase